MWKLIFQPHLPGSMLIYWRVSRMRRSHGSSPDFLHNSPQLELEASWRRPLRQLMELGYPKKWPFQWEKCRKMTINQWITEKRRETMRNPFKEPPTNCMPASLPRWKCRLHVGFYAVLMHFVWGMGSFQSVIWEVGKSGAFWNSAEDVGNCPRKTMKNPPQNANFVVVIQAISRTL